MADGRSIIGRNDGRRGIKNVMATIPTEDVVLMRALREEGLLIREIAEKFDANWYTTYSICEYKNRKYE